MTIGINGSVDTVTGNTGHGVADDQPPVKRYLSADVSAARKCHFTVSTAGKCGSAVDRNSIKQTIIECPAAECTVIHIRIAAGNCSLSGDHCIFDGAVDKCPVSVEGIRDDHAIFRAERSAGMIIGNFHCAADIYIFPGNIDQFVVFHKKRAVLVHPGDQRIIPFRVIKPQFSV